MVEPNGVSALQLGHARDQVRVGRLEHQLIVVAHQAIGAHLPVGFLADLLWVDAFSEFAFGRTNITFCARRG